MTEGSEHGTIAVAGSIVSRPLPSVSYPPTGNPAHVYLASLAEGSRRAMGQRLNLIARVLGMPDLAATPWHLLEAAHMTVIRSHLVERYAPATGRQAMSALRGVLHACWKLRLIDMDTRERLHMPFIKGWSAPAGRALTRDELLAVLHACAGDTHQDRRDAALLHLLLLHGLRRAEAIELRMASVRPDGVLIVQGKGNKSRPIPLTSVTWRVVKRWIDVRGEAEDLAPLFVRMNRGSQASNLGLTAEGVRSICERTAIKAGIEVFTPHDARRTCATSLLGSNVDMMTVSRLLGHASLNTTKRYDRRYVDEMRSALEAFALGLETP